MADAWKEFARKQVAEAKRYAATNGKPSSSAADNGGGGKAKPSPGAQSNGNGEKAKDPPKAPPCYYDGARKMFWTMNHRGEWMELNESGIRRHLKEKGFSSTVPEYGTISPLDRALHRFQHEHDVHFSCALAGYPIGVHEICASRVLVNRQRNTITPAPGKWNLLACFLEQLLGKQAIYFKGWIKSAMDALRAGPPFRRGQAFIVAGPSHCGKSLLQDIITEILGGRVGKPFDYLMGESTFNQDLLEAEHLEIGDESPPSDLKTRRYFGAKLKNFIANHVQRLHPKGGKAIPVTPFWRITISLNDEPENLMILPPLDESLRDKIILLRASKVEFPWDDEDPEGSHRFRKAISQELPHFLHYLRSWKIPEKLKDKRFGIRAAQNPELIHALDSLNPEFKLLELLDESGIWEYGADAWTGTAAQLERQLRNADRTGEVARLFSFNSACGTYLARLRTKFPERFQESRNHGQNRKWTIQKRKE